MIRTFRRALTSWVMLGFLALALIAIVVTGFGTGGMGGVSTGQASGETLVSVEDEKITDGELGDIIGRQLNRAREQQPELDIGTFLATGAFDQILNQVITGRALTAFGQSIGIAVSDLMIDREIANIAAFRNFAGQFDDSTFRQALRAQNLTEGQLRQDIANSMMEQQLLAPVGMGARVPQSLALHYASLLLETRRGTVGVVPSQAMAAGIAPSAAEVAAFYGQNQGRYMIPERRVIRFAAIGREQVAAGIPATEAEIAAYYRDNAAQYGGRETRNLSQVVLPDQAAARAFMARLQSGASFAQAAQQAGFSASDIALADQSQEQFAEEFSPAIANAAFSAQQGAVAGPIRSDFGFHVVKIDAINRTAGRPLAAVQAEIAAAIELRKFNDLLGALVTRVEDKIADGASFEEVVRSERLTAVETPPITATGQAPGATYQAPPELQPLLRGAFEMAADDDPVVETVTENQRFALLAVGRVVPAAAPPLAQIQQQVANDLIQRRASERARAVAASIVAKINAGTPSRQAFAEAGVSLPAPQPVNSRRMDIAQQGGQVPPPLAMMFSMAPRSAKVLEAPNGAGWFIVHLEERTPGNAAGTPQLIQATRSQFAELAGQEYAEQFARAIQSGLDVERNEEAIQRTRQRIRGAGNVLE